MFEMKKDWRDDNQMESETWWGTDLKNTWLLSFFVAPLKFVSQVGASLASPWSQG